VSLADLVPVMALPSREAAGSRHGRGHITMHLPEGWHSEREWMNLFRTHGPRGRPSTRARKSVQIFTSQRRHSKATSKFTRWIEA
jgi:hypothetical protein